jgi:hypothetical protein
MVSCPRAALGHAALVAVAAVLAFTGSRAAAQTPVAPATFQEPGIRQELLDKDLKTIRNLRELLPPGCDRLSKLQLAWPTRFNDPLSPPNRGPRDIGQGATDLHTQVSAGYLTCYLDVVAVDDRIAAARVRCETTDFLKWNQVKFRILSAWDGQASEGERGAAWRFAAREPLETLTAGLARELGPQVAVEVPAGLERPYRLLTDPLEPVTFGAACYDGGEPPAGRLAIDALLKADRWDLVRNVLRGGNPEGRVYAAEAFLTRRKAEQALDADDLRTIRAIHGQATPIEVCEGCVILRKAARDLFKLPE